MKKITLLLALLVASMSFSQVVINEVDADQAGTDTDEFIELLGAPNTALNGLVVVLFNGSDDLSYDAFDLTGSTDANGFFVLGTETIAGADIILGTDNTIQNGADAIAIYSGSAADWPNDTAITTMGLIDAIVYGTNDADDTELLNGLGQTVQYNEDANNNNADTESLQRRPDGSFCTATPSLRADNNCSDCALLLEFESAVCDAITDGIDTVTYTINFTGGGQEVVALDLDVPGSISGDDPSVNTTGAITVTLDEGVEAVLSATGATCDITITLFATTCNPATEVATIAELRALEVGTEVTLTGEAILTFQQDFRNQKFIEDATGAILIDDNPGIITTPYMLGDGITGIAGTLGDFNGMLQFSPIGDPGAASSSGNAVTPQVVSISNLNASPNDFESEYVTIEMVTIDNTPSATWDNGQEYPMTNPDGDFTFRVSFFDVDYVGQPVPAEATISGIITERNNGDFFITARDTADIESTSTCPLLLGAIASTCDTQTSGQDGTTTTIDFTGGGTQNYVITTLGGGTVAGDDPSTNATGTIILENVSEAATVTLEITSASCNISQDITTPACEETLQAATLEELRAGTVGEVYTLTGEAVLTYQQDFRNQKFIEDATGAILIDDNPGIITTAYAIGDGITGITGTLGDFNGMLQFSPTSNPGTASSTGNAIVAQLVTAAQLAASPNDYESEYVEIEQATIDLTIPNWETGTEYAMTTPGGAYTFRTSFFDADYIGLAVPTTEVNVAGIITERNNGDYFITARDLGDISEFLSLDENHLIGLALYPNPASDVITIQTSTIGQKQVQVFDVTGKKVLDTTVDTTLDVSELTTGLYILQVTQNNQAAIAKLIIR